MTALFAAEAYATLAEAGIAKASWYQLRENGILNNQGKLNPAYYGTQMFHIVAFCPGDQLLATAGASPTLAVHAAHRQERPYTVMLVNINANTWQHVKVTLRGANLAAKGLRFVYASVQVGNPSGPDRTEIKTDGNTVTVDLPLYSIVGVLLSLQK